MKGLARVFVLFAVLVVTVLAEKPNILVIFTDDQGYADLGCFGNEKNKTPCMDRLASEGTRFTSFYAQPVCGPSRSALLTGRYPDLSKGWKMPGDEITFAELLKPAGYQTVCIGKWDVSDRKEKIDCMPNAQGFDYYFGPLGANDHGIVQFHENNTPAGETTNMASLTRLYTDKAIDWLEARRDPGKPFVLYLAHSMMHTIIDASPEFKGRSAGGLYGDVVEEFDHETGRLLDKVDALGLRENTLLIYTSDNGPWCQEKYRKFKSMPEDGPKGGHDSAWYMPRDTVFWGDPGGLRGGKGSAYEAGSRVPCIVRWPGKVPADRTSDAVWATIDFLPTFMALAGVEVPKDRIIDGVDQTDLLTGKRVEGRSTFMYSQAAAGGMVGIRKGKWKLLMPDRKPKKDHRYLMDFGTNGLELYNLDEDAGEQNNVAAEHPEVVGELTSLLEAFKDGRKSKPDSDGE